MFDHRFWPQYRSFDNGDVHDLALNSDGSFDKDFVDSPTRYYFSAEMTTCCAAWFGDCERNGMMDHYKVKDMLVKAEVFPKGAEPEAESGCLYVYCDTPEIGHQFIACLNAYLEDRYQNEPELQKAHQFLVEGYKRQQKQG